jgi:hypothetical protein
MGLGQPDSDDDTAFPFDLQTFLGTTDSLVWLASEEGRCCLSERAFRWAICRAKKGERHRGRRSSPKAVRVDEPR